jgi:ribosomal protein L7/L12
MQPHEYFQSYTNYFWQWEEDAEVLAIPKHTTIAYRQLVVEIMQQLAPQGLPPFGSLLLAIIATNPRGSVDIDGVNSLLSEYLQSQTNTTLTDAFSFLKLLAEVPDKYKKGKNRLLLFQAIFEDCHNLVSTKHSKELLHVLQKNTLNTSITETKADFNALVFSREFRTIGLLLKKYSDVDSIVNSMAALPDFTEEIEEISEVSTTEKVTGDFVEQLRADSRTFHVGALITRIWGGLQIPAHSVLPSQQPLGGYSDITNKGDFDKLLVSEFASEDIVFLSRLANNEALFIQREVPPIHSHQKRIFLLDISLKNWGTPRILAFAVMLAIAKHPKSRFTTSVFVIGSNCQPISIDSIDTIIQSLQILDGCLHAARGLEEFFKNNPPDANSEVFLLTEPTSVNNPEMQRVLSAYQSLIHYSIYTTARGTVDVYRRQRNTTTNIQHLELPLETLWKNEPATSDSNKHGNSYDKYFPILVRNSMHSKKILSTPDGDIFQITKDKMLLRFFDPSYKVNEKGWEVIKENLPTSSGEFEIGVLQNGRHILLMFMPQNKQIILLDLYSGETKQVYFNQWKSSTYHSFVFRNEKFYHHNYKGLWSINTSGDIEEIHPYVSNIEIEIMNGDIFRKRFTELQSITSQYTLTQGIFKNITSVFINESNNLVFNIHELLLNSGFHIKLDPTNALKKVIQATQTAEKEFTFPDNSQIRVHDSGVLILTSSNKGIPPIYLPSVLGNSLGVATMECFAGNDYYYKNSYYDVVLTEPGDKVMDVIKTIQQYSDMGLQQAKDILDNSTFPRALGLSLTEIKASLFKNKLDGFGAKAELRLVPPKDEHQVVFEKIPTKTFYERYITAFIYTIQNHGLTT